jgi:hypothetical protein
MTSAAIPTMNNPVIPMSAACAVFFLAHANEKQGQAAYFAALHKSESGAKSVINAHPIGYDMTALWKPLPTHLRVRFQKFDPLM